MRRFTLLKGATILNIFFGIIAALILTIIGVIGVFVELGETALLQPMFDSFGKEVAHKINQLITNIDYNQGYLTPEILQQVGLYSHRLPSFIFEIGVGTLFMIIGFVGLALSVVVNIYGSKCLLRNIKEERLRVGRVNKFRAFFISVASLPLAPFAGLLMLLGTLFARTSITPRKESRLQHRQRNPYGPMV